ncbi:MAG: hypothetical protein JXA69_16065, partial [Phycisphaerae bacterium]|nr:hypothetical protein [Phycisphaerae bacterium]
MTIQRSLMAVLFIAGMPSFVAGQYSGGDGSPGDPWRIATVQDLVNLGNNTAHYGDSFRMTADINMAGQTFTTAVIAPDMGDPNGSFDGTAFSGVFDGDGHTIRNLVIDDGGTGNCYLGLFGYIDGGEVRNVDLEVGSVNGGSDVGGLVGIIVHGAITSCCATVAVNSTAEFSWAGGLVGFSVYGHITSCCAHGDVTGDCYVGGLAGGSTANTITSCHATGVVTGASNVGGLAGQNRGTITSSYATGTVSATRDDVGGLVGHNFGGDITSSYANGTVNGGWSAGGLVGENLTGTILACFATGATSASAYVGGLVGENRDAVTSCYATGAVSGTDDVGGLVGQNGGAITSCYATGWVTGGPKGGGLVGDHHAGHPGKVCLSFWDVESTGVSVSDGGFARATVDMLSSATYQGWGDGMWTIAEGAGYPHLAWEGAVGAAIENIPARTYAGDGGVGNPYVLITADDLVCMTRRIVDWDGHFALGGNIDMAAVATYLPPCGFSGVIDGQNNAISNLTINEPGAVFLGFLGTLTGGQVRNLGTEGGSITGADYVGGLAGYAPNGTLTACWTDSEVTGDYYVGGLVGEQRSGTITDSYAIGTVTGHDYYVGGLAGRSSGTITSCYATCDVGGGAYVGGLVGDHSSGTITDSHATGTVSGGAVGGLVGTNRYGGVIMRCYATGPVSGGGAGGLVGNNDDESTITLCYATGAVSSVSDGTAVYDLGGLAGNNAGAITSCYATGMISGLYTGVPVRGLGGLVGQNSGMIATCYATGAIDSPAGFGGLVGLSHSGSIVRLSFWDVETSSVLVSGGGFGRATADMRSAATYWGWGRSEWTNDDGADYPHLAWEGAGGTMIDNIPSRSYSGTGEIGDPYVITTEEDLVCMTGRIVDWASQFRLANHIDMTGTQGYLPPSGFSGAFDGAGHVISNLTIAEPGGSFLGLLGSLADSGEVRDLGVKDCSVTGEDYIGALLGSNSGTITFCCATGSLAGNDDVGGLAGNNSGTITSCYAAVEIDAGSHVGGLAGTNDYGTPCTITSCYSVGAVTGDESVGGLVGLNGWVCVVPSSYFLETAGPHNGYGVPLSDTAMRQQASFVDWDFDPYDGDPAAWWMPADDYPKLYWESKIAYDGQTEAFLPPEGSGSIEIHVFILVNQTLNWTLNGAGTCGWVAGASPSSGASAGPTDRTTVTIDIDATGLASGDYSCELLLEADNGDSALIPIWLRVHRIVYVDQGVIGGRSNGTSWSDAYSDLQDALDIVREGHHIWIAEGEYKPTAGTDRTISFALVSGVEVYGGFAGDEDPATFDLANRDFVANETILSGDIGVVGDESDNSYHVVVGDNLDASARLDGVTITGGNAGSDVAMDINGAGAGMVNLSASPTLANCIFRGNSAYSVGGGMVNVYTSCPNLTNCLFTGNAAGAGGGGMFNVEHSDPTLRSCTFSGNSAPSGAAIASYDDSSPTLVNCIVWGNTADDGSQIISDTALPVVTYSCVQGGTGQSWFGAGCIDTDPLFVDADGPDGIAGTADDNLRLLACSPCVDVGDNAAAAGIPADLDGNPRVVDGDGNTSVIVDMGVYELQTPGGAFVPDVVGLTQAQAEAAIASAGLVVGEVTPIHDAGVPVGT